jgi:hypothetical protein
MIDISEAERGLDRGALDRMSDSGVVRDIGEPGTGDSQATRLDADWWAGTALAIFSRLPRAQGAGGGSTLEQNQGLANQLMACFGSLATDSSLLGMAFGVPAGSKVELREAVAAALARLTAPSVIAMSSGVSAAPRPQADTEFGAASVPAGPAPSPLSVNGKTSGHYPEESRCIHGKPFSNDGRLSCVTKHRYWTYDTFRQAPIIKRKRGVREFERRADIQQATWKKRYQAATIIARRAEGKLDIDDDFYSLPNRDAYGGLPSDKFIGDVVHEYLQQRYLNHAQLADHAVVSEEGRRVCYFVGGKPGQRPIPIPFWYLVTGDPEPEAINSLAFSLGSSSWHLRPDIVDIDTKLIFEIKPIRSVHKGVLQLWRYVSNFRIAWTYDDIASRKPEASKWRVYELTPGTLPRDIRRDLLKPVKLYPLLQERGAGRDYARYRRAWLEPLMFDALPGVIAYRLSERKPEDPDKPPSIIAFMLKTLFVVAAIAVIAYFFLAALPLLLPIAVTLLALVAEITKGIIWEPLPGRQPTPILREAAATLNEALRSDSSQLAAEAAERAASVDLQGARP